MNIQVVVKPYELLFRLTPQGTIQGCHRKDIQELVDLDTGTVYNTKELDPVPIAGAGVDTILGTVNTSLVATLLVRDNTITTLSTEKETILGVLQQLQTDHNTLQLEKEQLLDDVATRAAIILELEEEVVAAQTVIEEQAGLILELQQVVAGLTTPIAEAPQTETPLE